MPDDNGNRIRLSPVQAEFLRSYVTDALPEPVDDPAVSPARAPRPVSLVGLQKARLVYVKALVHARDQLRELEAAIVARFSDTPYAPSMTKAARAVHGALKGLDTRLIACLDDALSAGDPATRAQKQKDAAGLIDGYIKAIDDNPVIGLIDDNPFHPVTVRRALETSLTALRAQLT